MLDLSGCDHEVCNKEISEMTAEEVEQALQCGIEKGFFVWQGKNRYRMTTAFEAYRIEHKD